MAANCFKRYGTNPGGFMGTRVWNQARSIGMEPGPFHTLQKVWNRRPFHRYGTDHVLGVARIRKIRGLILHDRTIPVPYPFHTSESDFQRIPHPRVWYRGPFHTAMPSSVFQIGIPFLQVPLSGSVSLRDSFKNSFREGDLSGKVWNKVRSIGMEPGPFHRYGTRRVPYPPEGMEPTSVP